MTAQNIGKYILCVALGIILAGCAQEMDTSFQKLKADPKVKLFQVFDETPAIKSMFDNIDQDEMNTKMNDLQNSNPELMAQMFLSLGNSMYGDNAPLPQMVKSMAEGLDSFHEVYSQDPDSLDATFDIADDVLRIDPLVMMQGTDTLITTLKKLRNWDDANNNGKVDPGETPYQWDFFGPYQEMSDMGYDGVNRLIDNLDFVHELYDGAQDMDDIVYLTQNLLQTVVDDNVDVEAKVAEVIDYIENPDPGESIQEIEEDVADWMIADPVKSSVMDYLVNDLYPMIERPVLDGVVVPDNVAELGLPAYISPDEEYKDYKNFIKRGRWVLDEQMKIFAATPVGLSQDPLRNPSVQPSTDSTLLTQWIIDAFSQDIQLWDHLESIDVFDFSSNNEMLYWLADNTPDSFYSIGEILKSSLKLGADQGIDKGVLKALLWDGWNYQASTGGAPFPFKGILYVDPDNIYANHGYVAKMTNARSTDTSPKPFREQINDMVNGDKDGNYIEVDSDDPDPTPVTGDSVFKKFHLSYAKDGVKGESQMESIMTNIQLYLLSQYYNPSNNKWASTPQDGQDYFGDSSRCLQQFLGGVTTSLRNMVVLNEDGVDPATLSSPTDEKKMSMLAQFGFLMAAGYGIVDPVNAPGELSLENCLKAMQSPLGGDDQIHMDIDMLGIATIHTDIYVLGNNDIRRQSSLDNPTTPGATWTTYATQNVMAANELLQPGTFRERTGGRSGGTGLFTGNVGTWRGKFSPTQGDLIGISIPGTVNGRPVDKLITGSWILSEVALVCWEGYGPYTYKGRAPNGSDCRYRNDWYSDWYTIKGLNFDDYGPGMHHGGVESRYHVYEAIYRPGDGDSGFKDSGFTSSTTEPQTKSGYMRPSGSNYVTWNSGWTEITLECGTREEAIRKNFRWLLNQKRYQYLIPIHGVVNDSTDLVIPWLFGLRIPLPLKLEIFAFSSINCNGIVGISKARRFQQNGDLSDNAVWPGGDLDGDGSLVDADGGEIYCQETVNIHNKSNTVLAVTGSGEPANTFRFTSVSFKSQDFSIALDFTYDFSMLGWDLIDDALLNGMMDIRDSIWDCLGDGPVLPSVEGDNFTPLLTMGNSVYTQADILSSGYGAADTNILKFGKFYTTYFPDVDYLGMLSRGEIRADELPAVPRVNGVYYPVTFNPDGSPASWAPHTGESKGKFEDFLGIFAMIAGTMHEDGIRGRNIAEAGDAPADISDRVTTLAQINGDNFDFYARDGFRTQIDNLVLTLCALNQTKVSTTRYPEPAYDATAIMNILVDHNPATDQTVAGSRKGLLPKLVTSKYANLNDTKPLKESAEKMIRNVIRTYMDSFLLSKGPGSDIEKYYTSGSIVNPDINWDTPINKLRFFMDNRSLDQLKRTLDLVKDMSQDARFVNFLKKSIPAVNSYLYIKWLEENWDGTGTRPDVATAEADGLLQLDITNDDIDDLVELLQDFNYADFIAFIQDSGLNDIDKIYNFTFDSLGEDITPEVLKEKLGDFNEMLVKYFGVNLLEGAVEGVYEIVTENPAEIPEGYQTGDYIYGFGNYMEYDEAVDGNNDGEIDFVDNEAADPEAPGYGIIDDFGDDNPNGYPIVVSKGKYLKYVEALRPIASGGGSWVAAYRDNEAVCKQIFPGLREFIDFRSDPTDQAFSETCLDYTSPWYRGGQDQYQCPNIFNTNNYDLRMDFLMDEFNEMLLEFRVADFEYGQTPIVERLGLNDSLVYNRPAYEVTPGGDKRYRAIDWLYGFDGSSYKGIDVQSELVFWKNMIVDAVFDDAEISIGTSLADTLNYVAGEFFDPLVDPENTAYWTVDPDTGLPVAFDEKYSTTSVRKLVQKARTYLDDEVFKYAFGTSQHESYHTVTSGLDLADGHRHALNNITEAAAELFSPVSRTNPANVNPNYMTHQLFTSLEDFIEAADIEPEQLLQVRKAVGHLLWDPDGVQPATDKRDLTHLNPGYYTQLFTKMSAHAPAMMRQFQGLYADLVQVGLLAFADDGIGSYMMNVMKPADQYDSWDLVEEFNYLINTEIFQNYTDRDTFWWQAGNLLEDLAIVLLRREERGDSSATIDYFGAVSSLFQ